MAAVLGHAEIADALKGIWPVTQKEMMMSLNGEWQLKVVDGVDSHDDGVAKGVPATDNSWKSIPVPGCWEAYAFCEPRYNYPDSLTGYYRTSFTVPREWKGQQVIIRLDGVLRGYDLWLNEQYVGTCESGYNTCLFDLTPFLSKKAFDGEPQHLAMRVYSRFKGYEFDCFDDWATMGFFRDVTLMAVPATHLSDLTVTTKMNGEVTVKAEVANATRRTSMECEIIDKGETISETTETGGPQVFNLQCTISNPHLWTAETPYLYTLRVRAKEKGKTLQIFEQKIGIREIGIEGNVLTLNGQPIKLRGVNAHSTDPKTVKVISDELTLKDMHMMKEASVNYMRLSHYPREPRFYELADSMGFYLDMNFEQTDRGIVVTVNAAVSGQGPKFAKTAFNGWIPSDATHGDAAHHGPVSGTFKMYPIKGGSIPPMVSRLFMPPSDVPKPFKPFLTQYDTYLLRFSDITSF